MEEDEKEEREEEREEEEGGRGEEPEALLQPVSVECVVCAGGENALAASSHTASNRWTAVVSVTPTQADP